MALASRMAKELKKLVKQPPPGISALPVSNSINQIDVQLQGPPDTAFEAGLFKLSITVPDRYPFEPPKVHFLTPVYHPNIDAQGRICLDYLNMPPKGCWGPAMDLYKVLVAIRQLLAEPNPKDPLMVDIAEEVESRPEVFRVKAQQHVALYATPRAAAAKTAVGKQTAPTASTTAAGVGIDSLQVARDGSKSLPIDCQHGALAGSNTKTHQAVQASTQPRPPGQQVLVSGHED